MKTCYTCRKSDCDDIFYERYVSPLACDTDCENYCEEAEE